MADLEPAQDFVEVSHDDRPLAVRRKRRATSGPHLHRDPQLSSKTTAPRRGLETPPATPHRSKKRARFSEPSIALLSTGLTPFVQRTLLSSPSYRSSQCSTPSKRRNLAVDDSPISGTLQFRALRQVLDARAKRRLRRNKLSEEMNNIEFDKRNESKAWKKENEQLKEELRQKDHEIQCLRNEQEIARQIDKEAGTQTVLHQTDERVRELEVQIIELNTQLQGRKLEGTQHSADWEVDTQDPYDDNDAFLEDFEDFNAEMTDVFRSTPTRCTFPSPPGTMPNTPSKPASVIDAGTQAIAIDPEKLHLESQLRTFKDQLQTLSKTLELTNATHERLTAKLTLFMPEPGTSENDEMLDAALDLVITELALSQSSAVESNTRFSALTNELSTLFASASCSDPESIIQLLRAQFRQARLDLEYLSPGENREGFENAKLLSMLISRLRVLTERVSQQDSSIDEYHELEISLRQQLSSHVDAVTSLQKSVAAAQSSVSNLESDLEDRDASISKLNNALQGYRDEVANLETLISRLEVEHAADLAMLRYEVESARKVAQEKLLDADLERDKLVALAEGRDIMISELERRLGAAHSSTQEMNARIEALIKEKGSLDGTVQSMRVSTLDREREHSEALELRDLQVAQLRTEVERLSFQIEVDQKRTRLLVSAITGMTMEYLEGNCLDVGGGNSASHNTSSVQGIVIPAPGNFCNGGLARRPSVGRLGKRRRYDSGMGFLDEEEEDEDGGKEEKESEKRSEKAKGIGGDALDI